MNSLNSTSLISKLVRKIKSTYTDQLQYLRGIKRVKKEYQTFIKSSKIEARFKESEITFYPCFDDNTLNTTFEPHYTYHPAWAARIVAKNKPEKHIDISSSLKFSTMLSAFVDTEFYDFRPVNINLSNLKCGQANLLQLPFKDNSIASLSCMHTIEHIGLGRYGDEIDYDGDLKAIKELIRVLAPGGTLLIVTPIGKAKIEYNAHRIYSYRQIMLYFESLKLNEFSLVPDDFEKYGLIKNPEETFTDQQNWGCGCFWFTK